MDNHLLPLLAGGDRPERTVVILGAAATEQFLQGLGIEGDVPSRATPIVIRPSGGRIPADLIMSVSVMGAKMARLSKDEWIMEVLRARDALRAGESFASSSVPRAARGKKTTRRWDISVKFGRSWAVCTAMLQGGTDDEVFDRACEIYHERVLLEGRKEWYESADLLRHWMVHRGKFEDYVTLLRERGYFARRVNGTWRVTMTS